MSTSELPPRGRKNAPSTRSANSSTTTFRTPVEIPSSYRIADASVTTQAIDYVAGMTDRFALREHDRIFRLRLFPE